MGFLQRIVALAGRAPANAAGAPVAPGSRLALTHFLRLRRGLRAASAETALAPASTAELNWNWPEPRADPAQPAPIPVATGSSEARAYGQPESFGSPSQRVKALLVSRQAEQGAAGNGTPVDVVRSRADPRPATSFLSRGSLRAAAWAAPAETGAARPEPGGAGPDAAAVSAATVAPRVPNAEAAPARPG